ncbi:MAG TPA: TadE family protein [Allosphingosinicella sp.]|nr:TadE family protein [Allosphingosinicella sp.]
MAARLGRLLALGRDEGGASVIEFALFAPILAVMVMGVSDLSMGYSRKLTLESAAFRSLEKVAVGSVQTDYQFLKAEAAAGAGVPQSNVTVDNWLECDRVRQTDFTGTCPTGQMTSRYVQVTINSTYTPRFNYGPLGGSPVPISASAALRIQ